VGARSGVRGRVCGRMARQVSAIARLCSLMATPCCWSLVATLAEAIQMATNTRCPRFAIANSAMTNQRE
jgi:hypothetical protein